jgi:hypothetical protein
MGEFIVLIGSIIFGIMVIAQSVDILRGNTVEKQREDERKAKLAKAHAEVMREGGYDVVRANNKQAHIKRKKDEAELTKKYGEPEIEGDPYAAVPRYKHRGPRKLFK